MIKKICLKCNKEFNANKNNRKFCSILCTPQHAFGKIRSLDDRLKQSKTMKGKKRNPFTEQHKNNISKSKTGKKLPAFTKEHKEKIGNKNRGKVRSENTKIILKNYFTGKPNYKNRGKLSGHWKGGITPINKIIRSSLEYRLWRKSVFKRDNYTCVWCKKRGGVLNADHIKPFAWFPELRFAIDNGRTLCLDCHKKTDTFGVKSRKYSIIN